MEKIGVDIHQQVQLGGVSWQRTPAVALLERAAWGWSEHVELMRAEQGYAVVQVRERSQRAVLHVAGQPVTRRKKEERGSPLFTSTGGISIRKTHLLYQLTTDPSLLHQQSFLLWGRHVLDFAF